MFFSIVLVDFEICGCVDLATFLLCFTFVLDVENIPKDYACTIPGTILPLPPLFPLKVGQERVYVTNKQSFWVSFYLNKVLSTHYCCASMYQYCDTGATLVLYCSSVVEARLFVFAYSTKKEKRKNNNDECINDYDNNQSENYKNKYDCPINQTIINLVVAFLRRNIY